MNRTIGVTVSGNTLGLSQEDWHNRSTEQRHQLRTDAQHSLQQAGAHYLIDSVKDQLPCLGKIQQRIELGESL